MEIYTNFDEFMNAGTWWQYKGLCGQSLVKLIKLRQPFEKNFMYHHQVGNHNKHRHE